MKVDRTRFLLLTGTISTATALAMAGASGCTVVSKGDGSDAATTPTTTDDGGSTTPATSDGGAKSDAAPTSDCLGSGAGDAGALDCTKLAANGCDVSCEAYASNFKPEVARAIADCLVKLPSCEGDFDAMQACATAALAKACDDPTAKTFCTPIASSCGKNDGGAADIDQSKCEALAKGLSTEGRASFLSCVDEGTPGYCTPDSSYCLDAMK